MKKKQLLSVLVTLTLFCYLFIHISYMHRLYDKLMPYYGLRKNSVDVVLVGTSPTFSFYMPMDAWEKYGIASGNFSTNMLMENSLRFMMKEVLKSQNPKYLMVDMTSFIMEYYAGLPDWGTDGYQNHFARNIDSMKYSLNRMELVHEVVEAYHGDFWDELYWNLDLSRYHTNPPELKKWNNGYSAPGRGYSHMRMDMANPISATGIVRNTGEARPPEKGPQLELLERVLETAREIEDQGCQVIFFTGPSMFRYSSQVQIKNYLKERMPSEGFSFWDCSEELDQIPYDYRNDFWNYNHMSTTGAEKATAYFAGKMQQELQLPDHRGDSAYSDWERDLPLWQEEKAADIKKDTEELNARYRELGRDLSENGEPVMKIPEWVYEIESD